MIFSYSNRAYPESIRNFVVENYFDLLKSSSEESFSPELTVLVCEPIIHAVAYCQSKPFFKQSSEALIQGLLPGEVDDEDDVEDEISEDLEENVQENKSESDIEEDVESINENDDPESDEQDDSDMEAFNDDAEFDSEEFDNIKDNCHDSEGCCGDSHDDHEHEHEQEIFDYSLLGKFIFDFGAREDVLVRNRRFLYELSQIIEEVSSNIQAASCCNHDIAADN